MEKEANVLPIDIPGVEQLNQRLDEIVAFQDLQQVRENLEWVAQFFQQEKGNIFSLVFSKPTLIAEIEKKLTMLNEVILPRLDGPIATQRSIASNLRIFSSRPT